jgi:opacity protein-like surface antigen
MKTLVLSFAVVLAGLCAAPPVCAADDEPVGLARGRVEFSTGASFTNLKESGDDDSLTVFSLPLRAGFLLTDHFGLEGEVLATHLSYGGDEESQSGVLFSGSALYHLRPQARTTPFLLVGGGAGNAVEYFNTLAADADRTVTTLHAGVGMKSFLGRRAALRAEYRFTRYSGGDRSSFGDIGFVDSAVNVHKVFAGISLFFR